MIQHIKTHTKRIIDSHKELYKQHKSHLALHTFLALITGLALHIMLPPVHTQTLADNETHSTVTIEHFAADTVASPIEQTLMDVLKQLDEWIEVSQNDILPEISLKIEQDSHDGVNVFVGTDGFTFRPRLAWKQNGELTEWHIVVYINDQYYTKSYNTSFHIPSHHYSEYEAPVILAMLVSNDHTPLLIQWDIIYDADIIK